MRRSQVVIAVLSTVGALAFTGVLFVMIGPDQKPAGKAAQQLAAAMAANDPSAAPRGTAEFVKGVRTAYGPVREARALEAYRKRIESGSEGHYITFWVTEIFVRAKRGAAVLEFENEDGTLTDIREVEPGEIHASLDEQTHDAVITGFAERGAKPADWMTLNGTFLADGRVRDTVEDERRERKRGKSRPVATPRLPAEVEKMQKQADKRLQCVQDADGDVTKLQKCGNL